MPLPDLLLGQVAEHDPGRGEDEREDQGQDRQHVRARLLLAGTARRVRPVRAGLPRLAGLGVWAGLAVRARLAVRALIAVLAGGIVLAVLTVRVGRIAGRLAVPGLARSAASGRPVRGRRLVGILRFARRPVAHGSDATGR
ncbi:hypothetical protein GCM10027605_07980 [Micromonospora zhanjiangensis]